MNELTPSLDEWLSVPEAAAAAGITAQTVRSAIERGRLPAVEKAGILLIHRSEWDRYRATARRGRPPAPKTTEAA